MSFVAFFHVRIKLVVGGLDFVCKLHYSSVQFSYSPLISRAQEFRVISLTADLETQGQILLLLCRVSYCIHYCSLQALFYVSILPKNNYRNLIIKSLREFMGHLSVSFFGVGTLGQWCFIWSEEWGNEVGRIKIWILLGSRIAMKFSPMQA